MRQEMLMKIHAGHFGVENCPFRARLALFWPRINSDIENLVSNCGTCQQEKNSNQKEPLINHTIPQYPWQVVAQT